MTAIPSTALLKMRNAPKEHELLLTGEAHVWGTFRS